MKFATALCISIFSLSSLDLFASAFVYPSSPVGATVWKPDSTVTIAWSDDKQDPSLASKPVFDIFLMTGSDDHQTKLATIATNVKGGITNSVKYVTKDGEGMAWATRFTITDEKGNHGTLHPTIPPGGKINPGGVGAIIPAPKKKGVPKDGTPAKAPPAKAPPAKAPPAKAPPAKAPPANAPAKAPGAPAPKEAAPKPVPEAVVDKQTEKFDGEAKESMVNNPSLVHVDTSSSEKKVASAGVPNAAPWFSMVMGAVAAGTIVLSML
ncbi:hypothetical protein BGZ82_000017 [Podila clonocystis]|nr:hypothetical protein BGZ82_000017 [Podila clonocystis]